MVRHDIFRDLSPAQLEGCLRLWKRRTLRRGQRLFEQGRRANSVAIVLSGGLLVETDDETLIGRVESDEVVGEAAGFHGKERTASVRAACDSQILVLKASELPVLRERFTPVYDRLLEQGLVQLARRVARANKQLALRSVGGELPQPRRPRLGAMTVEDVWANLRSLAPPDLVPTLSRLPHLRGVDPAVVAQVAAAAEARWVPAGRPVCLEGDFGTSLFVLAEGRVRVTRNTRNDTCEELAVLTGPSVFGTGGLLLNERRNASCVVTDHGPAWVYELPAEMLLGLRGEPARVLREALLGSLRVQIRHATERLAQVKKTGTLPM